MRLFMFYIGGDFGRSNIELHDIRFSVGRTLQDCYPDLRSQWWGDPGSLHLDCWGELAQADGHDVDVTAEPPPAGQDRLFFVNLGGYDPAEFAELHRNVLLVAPDATVARRRALALIPGWRLPHKDNIQPVEKIIDIADTLRGLGHYLRLAAAATPRPFTFTCDYRPIG